MDKIIRGMWMFGGLMLSVSAFSQNYTAVYDQLPKMSLDQSYSVLMEYQKANPYNSNVYAQIGSISEQKMVLYDPLRQNEAVRFWAGNVKLFYGNLRVYYKKGDCKSEFWDNLGIPFGERRDDETMWAYINKHMTMCKNHSDTTTLIYNAIERSKFFYNKALGTYKSICDEYMDMHELLLRNDDQLTARMQSMGEMIDNSVKEFDEYKRLTKLYPVGNYRQLYEKKGIETYRLDGLTNSDFYTNRFFMWDYRAWIDEYNKTFKADIVPLRTDAGKIEKQYRDGRAEYKRGADQDIVLTKPYDDMFLFRLGRYDNASLLRDLFAYWEDTRLLTMMAGDSLSLNLVPDPGLESRKMSQLYKMTRQATVAQRSRQLLSQSITPEKVAKFADFFKTNYGGESGLRTWVSGDEQYCQLLLDQTADEVCAYIDGQGQHRGGGSNTYSVKSGANPSVPLFVAQNPSESSVAHVTTHLAYTNRSIPAYVAGYQKANNRAWHVAGIGADSKTRWLTALKGVSSVTSLTRSEGGCLANVVTDGGPAIVWLNDQGQTKLTVKTGTEVLDDMGVDGVSGRMWWVNGNSAGAPSLSATDSLGVKLWTAQLTNFKEAKSVNVVASGYLVVGLTPSGKLVSVNVDRAGRLGTVRTLKDNVKDIVYSSRASASELSLLVRDNTGKGKYLIVKP